MATSYTLSALQVAFAANKCMVGIFNGTGSSQVVKVYRIIALNNQINPVIGALTNIEIRKLSACSGGSTIIPVANDSNSSNLLNQTDISLVSPAIISATWGSNLNTYTLASTTPSISTMTWSTGVIQVTTSAAHGLYPEQWVTISNSTPSGYNGTYSILACPTSTTFTVLNQNVIGTYSSGATMVAGHSYKTGQCVSVTGDSNSLYNVTGVIQSIPAADQITLTQTSSAGVYGGTGTIAPTIQCGTNQSYTSSGLYRRCIWSTDEPYALTTYLGAATMDELEMFQPFSTLWAVGYADQDSEPITLRAGEGVGVINIGANTGLADFFIEFTVT